MRTLTILPSEVDKITNNEPSFLGMDGGNIHSDLWFCGIEFGASIDEMEEYYLKTVKYYKVQDMDIPYRVQCPENFMKSKFDRSLAYLYLILTSNSIPDKLKIESVLKEELYSKESKIFKLNLFPLAKKDLVWDKNIEEKIKKTKKDYYGILYDNRILFIKKLVKQFSPRTILCFSPKEYTDTFIETFFDDKKSISYMKDFIILESGRKAKIKILTDQNIKVIIIPFLGRGNLSSYNDIRQMANYLKNNYSLIS